MNLHTKILTSIPSILSLVWLIDMWTVGFMWNTFPSMDAYHIQLIAIFIASILALIYLIRRLWSFENIPKGTKRDWTILMIFWFSQITTLYYIWKKDHEFLKRNAEFE